MIIIFLCSKSVIKMSDVFSSKLVKMISTFDSVELKEFDMWLNSPWANSNKALVTIVRILKPYHPDFNSGKLTKEKLFKKVLPKGKYSLSRINNMLSEGFHAAEQFVIFQKLKKDANLKQSLLLWELQNRSLEEWFFKSMDKEINRLEEKQLKEWEEHIDLLRLHRQVYHHPNSKTRMIPGSPTIVRVGEELELIYLLEQAATINEKIFRNRFLKNENHDIEKELRKWSVVAEECKHPSVELYRLRFSYNEENEVQVFWGIWEYLKENYSQLSEKELKIHLLSLVNDHGALFIRKKVPYKDVFPLYKLCIKTGILFDNGRLSKARYSKVVASGNGYQDFEFTESFIANHTDKLQKEIQSDACNWALAHTSYRKGELNKSLDILIGHSFKDDLFLRITKQLTLQNYFDLFLKDDTYQTYLFNYFDSYEKWLLREKLRKRSKMKGALNFVQVTRKMAKAYLSNNFSEVRFKTILKNVEKISAAGWVKERQNRIIELKNSGHLS